MGGCRRRRGRWPGAATLATHAAGQRGRGTRACSAARRAASEEPVRRASHERASSAASRVLTGRAAAGVAVTMAGRAQSGASSSKATPTGDAVGHFIWCSGVVQGRRARKPPEPSRAALVIKRRPPDALAASGMRSGYRRAPHGPHPDTDAASRSRRRARSSAACPGAR
jgi:hypothetical protein